MSWPTWTAAGAPIPTPMAAPVQSTLLPTALNSAPAVMAPVSYNQEQWAQVQQQNWQQWAQWQQQYQQWHQQYGAEYQKSLSAMQGGLPSVAVQPPLPTAAMAATVIPPLPVESKPPLPPEDPPTLQSTVSAAYTTGQPNSHQIGYTTAPLMTQHVPPLQVTQPTFPQTTQTWQNTAQKRPHQDTNYDHAKRSVVEIPGNQWSQQKQVQTQWQGTSQNFSQPPPQIPISTKPNVNVEELSEAEKKFDKEFAAWEAQFNRWKEQNANHPDKTQYKEYEKKWESWRNSLLERREQMRRKRLGLGGQSLTTAPKTPITNSSSLATNPAITQSLSGNKPLLGQYPGAVKPALQTNDLFSKLPPTHNDEPLTFKTETMSKEQDDQNAGEGFLNSSSSGGIPGLDLVKDDSNDENLPDRSDDKEIEKIVEPNENPEVVNKGPDFEAISKGINSILGDQKLLSMLSMVSQNPPVGANATITTNTAAIPPNFPQNFGVPPPNLHQHPPGKIVGPPPTSGDPQYPEFSNQSSEICSNKEEYYQGRETLNRFGGPNIGNNFDRKRDIQSNFGSFDDRENTSRGSGNFNRNGDNYNQSDRFNNRFDDGPQFNRSDDRDKYNGSGGTDNFKKHGSFNKDNFGSHDKHHGRSDNFRQENYDDYDNYNEEDDYEKYNELFKDEDHYQEDRYQEDRYQEDRYQEDRYEDNYKKDTIPQQSKHKISSLMDLPIPAPPNIRQTNVDRQPNFERQPPNFDRQPPNFDRQPPNFDRQPPNFDRQPPNFDRQPPNFDHQPPNFDRQPPNFDRQPPNFDRQPPNFDRQPIVDPQSIVDPQPNVDLQINVKLFEPATVIDYQHKSKKEADDEVTVVPVNMFDYRHIPLNRIQLPQRPKWLAESVKFIREFDPTAVRFESRKKEEGKDRLLPDDRGNRRDKSFEWEEFPHDRKNTRDRLKYNERDDYKDVSSGRIREERYKPNNSEKRKRESNESGRNEQKKLTKDFEDFSDTDMDFEQSEQVRHNQDFDVRRSKSKSPELSNPPNPSSNQIDITMIEDIINPPGRHTRPPRIVIILRGPPGSGKTFLAKQIKDKEVENGGSAPRILSLDDYFMVEQEHKVSQDGKMQTVKKMVYEYEAEMEESYRTSFMKSFKKTITDGYFPFIIVDNVNDKVRHFGEMWSFAKQNGFQVYICQMDLDPVQCAKRNIHNRTENEIEEIILNWEPTPSHHPTLDASGLLQMCAIVDVEMEVEDEQQVTGEVPQIPEDQVRSKWDNFDCSSNNLAKLDGVSKPIRKSRTMEEYLQLESQWEPPKSTTSGKKRVRWADLEEQRELEKMRAIGFVVGHTDWDRMMDPTGGRRALTQTKYIENTSRYKRI